MGHSIRLTRDMRVRGWFGFCLLASASIGVLAARSEVPPAVPTIPDNDATPLADEAVAQFKLGHLQQARELLRKAIWAFRNLSEMQTGTEAIAIRVFQARALIDPPSTRPVDGFADSLNAGVWPVVKVPGLPSEKYAVALKVVERSVAIDSNPYNLSTLGAAQFRMGNYEAALRSLARSDATDFIAQENHASNLAFSAMAEEKLRHHAKARATLQQVIDLAKVPNAITGDDVAIFNEAAAMIDPASTQPTTVPSNATEPLNDAARLAGEAVAQFKLGHVPQSQDLLRRSLWAYRSMQGHADTNQRLNDARSLIDPPSTRPTDHFADSLNNFGWDVVKMPGQPGAQYAIARELLQAAVGLDCNASNLNSLGAAQFRTGNYKAALESLARADAVDFVAQDCHVSNLAFSAMAEEKLGQHAKARATLQQVLDLAKIPNAITGDDVAIFKEAAAMIDPAASTHRATVGPANDASRLASKATAEFKLGHVEQARDLLRRALWAFQSMSGGTNAYTDANQRLLDARALIDPPSIGLPDDFADALNGGAWDVVKVPGQPGDKYAAALEVLQRSVDLDCSPCGLNRLGAAQFRTGDYEAALQSLARSGATDFYVSSTAFSAMAEQKLGHHSKARATLQQLIDLAKVPNAIAGDDVATFNEAAAMIDPASTQPTTAPAAAR